jgi:outer membrane cobalamin receptor
MNGIVLLTALLQFAQSSTGELRLTVTDPAGLPLQSQVALVSAVNQVAQTLETGTDGTLIEKRLPFGRYRLEVARAGFAPYTALLDIESAVPKEYHVTLTLAPVQSQVIVTPDATLLDNRQTSTVNRIGTDTLQRRITALPSRSLSDVVNTEPGWLLEANGILHPRGSEYQVQYVIDGLPVTDNRSPSFAPELDANDVHAMSIITGGFPAEYGRKLGGVIEVVTAGDFRQGLHGSAVASAGSFGTGTGSVATQYGWRRTIVGLLAGIMHTNRYLDPPVEENFTNAGTGSNLAAQIEREFSGADRLGVTVRHGRTDFLVPNERVQEEAGQRQDRRTHETSAQMSYQHLFSANVVGDVRGMARTLGARLSSNALSTPIAAEQDRGFREGYVKGTVTAHAGAHEWRAGIDVDISRIREAFDYRISDPSPFDPGTPLVFTFSDQRADHEQAIFVQDRVAAGPWTLNAGLRWDHYRLLVEQSAWSPRLGVAWSWPGRDLVVRASYDRAFQTPATENLLLAASSALESVSAEVLRLPVRPSLGNFFEVGLSKRLFSTFRLDVAHFRREMTNFADDDLLLNTGVSFPIAFRQADVQGTEVKLELPAGRAVAGSLSYANMVGTGSLPITGGLLLGEDATIALTSTDRFPISQDQRHTVRGRLNYQLSPKAWVAVAASYGSGLPVELEGDLDDALAEYGRRIVDRVDVEAGRVRPSASIDAAASYLLFNTTGGRRLRVQADVLNLANRLNVINFAGLFSGTAIGSPRSFAVRLQAEF